jgi:hypothetical protein
MRMTKKAPQDEFEKKVPGQEADGYFDMDDAEDDELDLSFLDEEESEDDK